MTTPIRILVVGDSEAGKTTLLNELFKRDTSKTVPTLQFEEKSIQFNDKNVIFIDTPSLAFGNGESG